MYQYYQYRYINFNKCNTLMQNVTDRGICVCKGESIWECLFCSICLKAETALKHKVC